MAAGEAVRTFKPGDRIAAAHHVPCNTCHYCLNGHHTVCETLRRTNFYPGRFFGIRQAALRSMLTGGVSPSR